MSDRDRIPGTGADEGSTRKADGAGGSRRWVIAAWILLVGALLALIVFLHLSGAIGPGVH
jgi:hypothetical protein